MPDITYALIEANIGECKVNGANVDVGWKCAVTGRDMGRSGAYMSADHSLGNEVTSSVKRSVVREVLYGIARAIGNMFGGMAGRVARDATYTATSNVNQQVYNKTQYTEKSRRDAIVQAFKAVEEKFAWDEAAKKFKAR